MNPVQEHYDGGQAFPVADFGMTLRDYFAAKVVAAFIGNWDSHSSENYCDVYSYVAANAYELADVMIKVRNK